MLGRISIHYSVIHPEIIDVLLFLHKKGASWQIDIKFLILDGKFNTNLWKISSKMGINFSLFLFFFFFVWCSCLVIGISFACWCCLLLLPLLLDRAGLCLPGIRSEMILDARSSLSLSQFLSAFEATSK